MKSILNLPARILVLGTFLLLFLGSGCDNASTPTVHTGTNLAAGNGDLTFQFLAPQVQAIQAPEGASSVLFEMFDQPNQQGTLVDQRTEPFATTITLLNVSNQTDSIRITIFDAFGIPLTVITDQLQVVSGQTTVVDLTAATQIVPSLDQLLVTPDLLIMNTGDTQALGVTAVFGNGSSVNLGGQLVPGLTYTSQAEGVVTATEQGVVSAVGSGVTDVQVTLTTNGRSRTTTVPALVDQPRLAFSPGAVTLPIGGIRYAPIILSNGLPVSPDDYDFSTSTPVVATVSNGVITSGLSTGPTVITVRDKTNPNIFAQMQVTTVDATITGVTTPTTNFSMYVSQATDIDVTASLSNGDTMVAAQNSPDLDVQVGQDTAALVDRQLVALVAASFPPTAQPVEIGFPTGTTQSLSLTIREVQLTGTELRLGGLAPGDTGYGSLPQGQWGVVELDGIFEDGSRRLLRANDEYTASSSNGTVPYTVGMDKINGRLDSILGTAGSTTTTLSIELADEIGGSLNVPAAADLTLNVAITDGSMITDARLSYQNYPDDLSFVVFNTATRPTALLRPQVVRADFPGVPNFRVAGDNVDPVAEPPSVPPGSRLEIRCRDVTTPEEWPVGTCIVNNEFGQFTPGANARYSYRINQLTMGGSTNLGASNFVSQEGVIPASVTVVPTSTTTEVGRRISYRTIINYGDGRGPLVRTLDYPVVESTFDQTQDVWAVNDTSTESNTFFLKKTSANHGSDFVFRAVSGADFTPFKDVNPSILDSVLQVVRRL